MAAVACRQSLSKEPARAPLTLIRPPVKFDAAFIERRLREHKAWQEEKAAEGAAEIVREVVGALDQVMRVRSVRNDPQRLK
jgi:hypothetical protein